ncbi:MAG: hypothetical protein F6K56_40330 [Moorea sp. SIO3G5]|nr:hypothetical protein [Moorena sp. SIO3G5]
MNARSSGFIKAPVGPPILGDAREFFSPQNWGARGAKPYPESATPDILSGKSWEDLVLGFVASTQPTRSAIGRRPRYANALKL